MDRIEEAEADLLAKCLHTHTRPRRAARPRPPAPQQACDGGGALSGRGAGRPGGVRLKDPDGKKRKTETLPSSAAPVRPPPPPLSSPRPRARASGFMRAFVRSPDPGRCWSGGAAARRGRDRKSVV